MPTAATARTGQDRPATRYAATRKRRGKARSPGSTLCCGARCSNGRRMPEASPGCAGRERSDPEQRDTPVVYPSQSLGDRLVAAGPVPDCEDDGQQAVAGERKHARARDLGPRIAALVLDAVDRLVEALPLPSVQHRFQRRVTVGDVAVESFRRQGAEICRRVRRSMMSRLGDEQPSWW